MDNSSETITMKQAAERLGVTTQTIRRCCNYGLVYGLRRTRSGRRIFTPAQVDELSLAIRLRSCGLSLAETKKYLRLARLGASTAPARKLLLQTKKRQLWLQLSDLQQNIDFIERQEELLDQPA